MNWARQGICAASIVLLLAAGCVLPDYLGLNVAQSTTPGGERVLGGSLEAVSRSTQGRLRQLGFLVVATPEADAIRLACSTRENKHFDLVLTRVQSPQGEQTRVRLEWQGGVDDQIGLQVFAGLSGVGSEAAGASLSQRPAGAH